MSQDIRNEVLIAMEENSAHLIVADVIITEGEFDTLHEMALPIAYLTNSPIILRKITKADLAELESRSNEAKLEHSMTIRRREEALLRQENFFNSDSLRSE